MTVRTAPAGTPPAVLPAKTGIHTACPNTNASPRPSGRRACHRQAGGRAQRQAAPHDADRMPVSAFAVTMPPWPAGSDDEWVEVAPYWPV